MIYKYLSSSLLRRSIQSDIIISSSWYDGGGVDFTKLKVRAYVLNIEWLHQSLKQLQNLRGHLIKSSLRKRVLPGEII